MNNIIDIRDIKGEPRIDSRIIARELGIQHGNLMGTIHKYREQIEGFGQLPFKTEVGKRKQGGGNPLKYSLLNEDQCHFVLTLSRNTQRVVELKAKLVLALRRYRETRQIESSYLPFYRSLHDSVKELANRAHESGSTTPDSIFHSNFNRLINKLFGIEPGDRKSLSPTRKAMVTAAQAIATETLNSALAEGGSHKDAYSRVKDALEVYAASSVKLIAA